MPRKETWETIREAVWEKRCEEPRADPGEEREKDSNEEPQEEPGAGCQKSGFEAPLQKWSRSTFSV